MDTLTEDDLDTIMIIARNGQSGRITEREIKLLVSAYQSRLDQDEKIFREGFQAGAKAPKINLNK